MAVNFYSSEDAGAPQWNTSVSVGKNNIIEILDAVLLTGYGSKPGLGWTKEMASTINDRTVYSNQSAHANKMNLLVQSHPSNSNGAMFQIAESVVTPEEFYGYSSCISCGTTYGVNRWIIIGDERTFIFALMPNSMKTSHFYVYAPNIIYVGDVDTDGFEMPNAWCLLGSHSYNGSMNTITNPNIGYGIFNSIGTTQVALTRPFTALPGEDWSENNMSFQCMALNMSRYITDYWPSKVSGIEDLDEFLTNVSYQSDWYIYLESKYVFRLRGCISFTPELFYFDKANGQTRGFVPFTIDGIDYCHSHNWNGMFFQTSGEW
ncbi:hypothetical protein [uncultured Endozoicomonas sp.]|uniref:hypothetical protein n=1 Tax=uncultured Endozoicomonas sp. TaxID=432652 RepID=UPI002624D67D|nr:hypothetical protein [uncultured Endozoicomonas sp.]